MRIGGDVDKFDLRGHDDSRLGIRHVTGDCSRILCLTECRGTGPRERQQRKGVYPPSSGSYLLFPLLLADGTLYAAFPNLQHHGPLAANLLRT